MVVTVTVGLACCFLRYVSTHETLQCFNGMDVQETRDRKNVAKGHRQDKSRETKQSY